MSIGGFDYKRAVDVAKFVGKEAEDRSLLVTVRRDDFVSALAQAYQRGWEEAIRAKEAREERG